MAGAPQSAGDSETIQVRINGENRRAPAGSTVSTLLADLGLKEDQVAVELDLELVRRADWASAYIRDGAQIEVVRFVGGG